MMFCSDNCFHSLLLFFLYCVFVAVVDVVMLWFLLLLCCGCLFFIFIPFCIIVLCSESIVYALSNSHEHAIITVDLIQSLKFHF